MTTDLERRLRQTLDQDASEAPRVERAPGGLRRRVRRRQAGTTAAAVAGLAAVVALTVAGVQAFDGDDRFVPTPRVETTRPVFERSATIEGFTVTSPSDWYLVDYWPVMGGVSVPGSEPEPGPAHAPVLQLTNYDPGLGASICGSPAGAEAMPADGVGLYVGFLGPYYSPVDRGGTALDEDFEVWPNALAVEPTRCNGGTELLFGVRRGDRLVPYFFWYGIGPEASDEDRAMLDSVVASFDVTVDQPELRVPGTDTPGYVLWGGANEDGSTWTIEARPTEVNVDLKLVTRETDGTYSEGGVADFGVPPNDVEGSFMGVVIEDAERVEFVSSDGSEPAVAQLADLPATLGYEADAYWFPKGYPTKDGPAEGDLVVVMPSDATSSPPPDGVIDRAVLDEGTYPEPDGRAWILEIQIGERIDAATGEPFRGISLAWEGGGAIGGSISSLDGHVFRGHRNAGGTDIPDSLLGPVSIEASRVVFRREGGGDPIEAQLIAVPERFLGPAQIFLVTGEFGTTVPDGRLIAYDERGQVLDTYPVDYRNG